MGARQGCASTHGEQGNGYALTARTCCLSFSEYAGTTLSLSGLFCAVVGALGANPYAKLKILVETGKAFHVCTTSNEPDMLLPQRPIVGTLLNTPVLFRHCLACYVAVV